MVALGAVVPAFGTVPVVVDDWLAADPSLIVPPADGPAPGLPGPPLEAPPWAKAAVPMVRTNADASVIDLKDNVFPPVDYQTLLKNQLAPSPFHTRKPARISPDGPLDRRVFKGAFSASWHRASC
ncbi:hypothetical protein FV225_02450 [Methylobacterium sp. WL93]|uniref:hypothetical protein n=1 Tax=Methylobacterium sp. WL93 TaxID=2603892 RepID=UPI0011C902DD|nr:hypothetical protein [Methylobacterium sp. WL93]TXN41488.1 hypothetical protein FV225_02450 [Methylobacterium sp. WL93]